MVRKILVVYVKTPSQPRNAFLQRPGTDKRRRLVTQVMKYLSQQDRAGVRGHMHAVDIGAMLLRIERSHHRDVRRPGQRNGRVGVLKQHTVRCQIVDSGRCPANVPIAGKMVGPGRVKSNQQDIRRIFPVELCFMDLDLLARPGQGDQR